MEEDIPMIILKQHGQIGYLRIFKNCYTTSETKEDSEKFDLRITEPFEILQQICDDYKFDELGQPEHKLIPFIVILIQALKKWREEVGLIFWILRVLARRKKS